MKPRHLYDDYNDYEINEFEYLEAQEKKLSFYEIYYRPMVKTSQIIIFTFLLKDDYNSREIKICLLLIWLSSEFAINALCFNDYNLHKIYEDKGEYNFIYQLSNKLYSTIISAFISMIIKYLSLSEKNILNIKDEKIGKAKKTSQIIKCLNIKFIIFFILCFLFLLFLLFFWFYLSCFC